MKFKKKSVVESFFIGFLGFFIVLSSSKTSSLPSVAKEIVPVSSDTTTVSESVISLIPKAARCLAPYSGLNS